MQISNNQLPQKNDSLTPRRSSLSSLGFIVILLISIAGIQKIFFPGPTTSVIIYFSIDVIIALLFIKNAKLFFQIDFKYKNILIWFFIYGVFVFTHSLFVANSYEQWRYVLTSFAPTLLLPFFSLLVINPVSALVIFKTLIRITIPISFIFIIEGRTDDKNHNLVYVNYISFIYLFIILLPFLRNRWKIAIVIVSLLSFTYELDNRSNLLSIASSYAIVIYYYLSKSAINISISKFALTQARRALLFIPILLIGLGGLGLFNVFEYIENKGASAELVITGEGRVLTTDSRTGIYEDALGNLKDKNDWLFGSSAAIIYSTKLAEDDSEYVSGRLGGSESGFIGLVTFGGLVYSLLFFALCYFSSYLAMYKSKNTIVKLICIFVTIRWFYSFIENTLLFNFTWITLFLALGITFSSDFRSMSDRQFSDFLKRI